MDGFSPSKVGENQAFSSDRGNYLFVCTKNPIVPADQTHGLMIIAVYNETKPYSRF